jgi:hypothetical protein
VTTSKQKSSVTLPIRNENLQEALDEKVSQLTENGFEPQFSPDISHQCRGMGVKILFPAGTNKEEIPCVQRNTA